MPSSQLDVNIRLAIPADIHAIHRTHLDSVQQLCGAQYSARQIATWLDGRHPEVYLQAIGEGKLWVAEQQGIAGFVEVEGKEVTKMFVAGSHAGQGVGERLLSIALKHIAASGAPSAYLESTLTAVKFYEKNGFRVIGTGLFSRGNSPVQLEIIKMEQVFGI